MRKRHPQQSTALRGWLVSVPGRIAASIGRSWHRLWWLGRTVPIEVLVSDRSRRRPLERELRWGLSKLRHALGGPIPPELTVLVQQVICTDRQLAGCYVLGQHSDGSRFALVRLALQVDGHRLTTDDLLAVLAEQLVGLATQQATSVLVPIDLAPATSPPADAEAAALKVVTTNLEYFAKRREQIRYAAFAQAGYPFGSGAVESGNKLVVEARLKGAGMHWAPEHVNPMVALRTTACSDRWDEAWPLIVDRLRAQTRERSAQRRAAHHAVKTGPAEAPVVRAPPSVTRAGPPAGAPVAVITVASPPIACPQVDQVSTMPWRPAANHPWRRQSLGRAHHKPLAC